VHYLGTTSVSAPFKWNPSTHHPALNSSSSIGIMFENDLFRILVIALPIQYQIEDQSAFKTRLAFSSNSIETRENKIFLYG